MKTQSAERLVVLLAEDDEDDLVLTRRAFRLLGNLERLIWLADGEQTLAYLQGQGCFSDRALWPLPTVAILDRFIPKRSGLEVLQWLRDQRQFSQLPVVIHSGILPPTEEETLEHLHAACCLKRPNAQQSAESLAEAICSALRLAWMASLINAGKAEPVAAAVNMAPGTE